MDSSGTQTIRDAGLDLWVEIKSDDSSMWLCTCGGLSRTIVRSVSSPVCVCCSSPVCLQPQTNLIVTLTWWNTASVLLSCDRHLFPEPQWCRGVYCVLNDVTPGTLEKAGLVCGAEVCQGLVLPIKGSCSSHCDLLNAVKLCTHGGLRWDQTYLVFMFC